MLTTPAEVMEKQPALDPIAVTGALATLREQLPPESRRQDVAVDAATLAAVRALIAASPAGPPAKQPAPA